jgi:hypothetical protein
MRSHPRIMLAALEGGLQPRAATRPPIYRTPTSSAAAVGLANASAREDVADWLRLGLGLRCSECNRSKSGDGEEDGGETHGE